MVKNEKVILWIRNEEMKKVETKKNEGKKVKCMLKNDITNK